MKRNLHLLTTPGFLAGLSLLLANDFLFKPLFHNWLTGKLSDFAGLFIFTLFWTAFVSRSRRAIYLLTAIAFAFWKSLYSQPLIDWWNTLPCFNVQRTVDSSDLIALSVLPLSYFYTRHSLSAQLSSSRFALRRLTTYTVILISVFAFTATQRVGDHMVTEEKEYEFQTDKDDLLYQLEKIVGYVRHYRFDDEYVRQISNLHNTPMTEEDRNVYTFKTRAKFCNDTIYATVTLYERGNKTVLRIDYLIYNCDASSKQHELEATRTFERDVIDKLREKIAQASSE